MKNFYIFMILLFSLNVFAQINFEPGYVVDNFGRKTECLIRNVDWGSNPYEIDYKLSETGEVQTKKIAEIKEFSINDSSKYVRFTVDIDRSTTDINKLTSQKNPVYASEKLFLKVLSEGKTNLYSYESANLVRYFYSQDQHLSAVQLVYKTYLVKAQVVGENNYFRQQLFMIFEEGKHNSKDFEKLKYDKTDLIPIFEKYNGNSNILLPKNSAGKKGKLNLKIIAGLGTANLTVTDSYQQVTFNAATIYNAGLEAEYHLPFNKNKWSLFLAPMFQTYKGGKNSETKPTSNYADYKSIEIPFGLRYHFFVSKSAAVIAEAGYNIALNLSPSYIQKSGFYGEGEGLIDITKSGNFFFGTGFHYGKFSLGLRYSLNRNILQNYIYYDAKFNSASAIFGYKFL